MLVREPKAEYDVAYENTNKGENQKLLVGTCALAL